MTRDAATSYDEAYSGFYEEALSSPMPWFPMDSDFMRDGKIRRLAVFGGWRYVGMYVALIACLASTDNHMYDLSDEYGWLFLRSDMSVVGCQLEEDELREFIGVLLKLGLLDVSMWDESSKLTCERMIRNAHEYAQSVAAGKAKGLRMRQGKTAGKQHNS